MSFPLPWRERAALSLSKGRVRGPTDRLGGRATQWAAQVPRGQERWETEPPPRTRQERVYLKRMQGIVPPTVKSSDNQKMVNNVPPQNLNKSNSLDADSALLSVVVSYFNEAAISRGEAKRRPLSLVKERLGFPSGENAERETAE